MSRSLTELVVLLALLALGLSITIQENHLQQPTHLSSYEDRASTRTLGTTLRDVREDSVAKGPWWDARHDRANARRWAHKISDAKEDAKGHGYEDKATTRRWKDRAEDSHGKYTVAGLLARADRAEDRGTTATTRAKIEDLSEDAQAKGPWWEARHDRAEARREMRELNDAKEDAHGTSYEDKRTSRKSTDVGQDSHGRYTLKAIQSSVDRPEDRGTATTLRTRLTDLKEDASAQGPWWDARHDRAHARSFRGKLRDVREDAHGTGYEDKKTTAKWNDLREDTHRNLRPSVMLHTYK